MNTQHKLFIYLITLLIELVCGIFRLVLTLPLAALLLWAASRIVPGLEIPLEPASAVRLVIIVGVLLAYANIIASIFAYLGFGGGSLLTRFVLGARRTSTRERETLNQLFGQIAESARFPIRSFSKLYVIDATLESANLIGTTLYISRPALRGQHLPALVTHEFGHLHNGDGSLILALRRLVFPPFSLFISGIRDFSTNRPTYRPRLREFDAVQTFYSMVNAFIFFTVAFIGGGIGVWFMSWAWANYFRQRDYAADSFAAKVGYKDDLVTYLERNIFYSTSVPYMLGWQPANELRIDALLYPASYGLGAAPSRAAAEAGTPVVISSEGPTMAADTQAGFSLSPRRRRTLLYAAGIAILGYLLISNWSQLRASAQHSWEQFVPATGQAAASPINEVIVESRPAAVAAENPVPERQVIANCPKYKETGKDLTQTWQISVPEEEIAFVSAWSFDEYNGGVLVTVTGPYEGLHTVIDGALCWGIPADADYMPVREQRLAGFTMEYQELFLPHATDQDSAALQAGNAGTCPALAGEAATLFGGNLAHWQPLNAQAWKYGPAPTTPINNLNIPAAMKGDWWDDYQAQSAVGPAQVGYASEATIWCLPPNDTFAGSVIPTTPEEAMLKWGGDPTSWSAEGNNGWHVQAPLTLYIDEGWRIDYTDPNGQVRSCGDIYEPGVYGPATVAVSAATLWYVPEETQCPSWSPWAQAHP